MPQNPDASSHNYSDANSYPGLLDPSILRVNQVHLLFVLFHLPGCHPSPDNNQHVHDPSVLRIHRTVLLLACLPLPGIAYILHEAVLLVDADLLLSSELHLPAD